MINFSVIICTFKRAEALSTLLDSLDGQSLYPIEILIIDGSPDDLTAEMISQRKTRNLLYYKVEPQYRGLTKQRNFGIGHLSSDAQVAAFLDDDTVLDPDYFKNLIETYILFPEALGVGGFITNESKWQLSKEFRSNRQKFCFDGWCRDESSRFTLRRKLGLDSNLPPGFMPRFSHGRSVGFLPPSEKIYPVQQLMGANFSFRTSVFKEIKFSTYFEGYGLYEDADFTIKVYKKGPIYLNTSAKMEHHHDPDGRPNLYKYGRMVVQNGWYVWRLAYENPGLINIFKWYAITIILIVVRLSNVLTTNNRKGALYEFLGRCRGLITVVISPPQIDRG